MTDLYARVFASANTGDPLERIVLEVMKRTQKGVNKGGSMVLETARNTLSRTSTRMYPWDKSAHPSSRSGESVTTLYQWKAQTATYNSKMITTEVGSESPVLFYQESGLWAVGASKMGWHDKGEIVYPYPWLKPSLTKNRANIISAITEAVNR